MLIGKKKKEAKAALEEEILEKFRNSPILENLICTVTEESKGRNEWIRSEMSYYDKGERTVAIGRDFFKLFIGSYYMEKYTKNNSIEHTRIVRDVAEEIAYSYTGRGYEPLGSFTKDKLTIPYKRVCYLWATVVRDAMEKAMPECKFSNTWEEWIHGDVLDPADKVNEIYAEFSYRVPKKETKGWF